MGVGGRRKGIGVHVSPVRQSRTFGSLENTPVSALLPDSHPQLISPARQLSGGHRVAASQSSCVHLVWHCEVLGSKWPALSPMPLCH